MKYFLKPLALAVALIWAGTGCVTTQDAGPPPASQADVSYLRNEIRRLNVRLDATDSELGRMQGEVMSSRSSQPSTASLAQLQSVKEEVNDLQGQIRAVDAARAKDKKQIYDDLTKKISKMLKSSSSSSYSSRSRPRSGSQSGIEHVVKAGQTLSQIASAYGVTTRVLVEENGLKSADAIYAGQKLFIPE
jgi:LysM repeat protein